MKWTKKRKVAVLAGTIVLVTIIPLGLAGGCGTTTRPPKLTRSQRALIRSIHFPYTVGVEKGVTVEGRNYDLPAYTNGLVGELRRTGLFDRVDHLKAFKTPPDFVARVEETIPGRAIIPFVPAITLGIVPISFKDQWGYAFSLRRPDVPTGGSIVGVRYVWRGRSTMGWIAVFLNALPNHTWRDLDEDPRFIDHVALEIVKHRHEIEALAARKGADGENR